LRVAVATLVLFSTVTILTSSLCGAETRVAAAALERILPLPSCFPATARTGFSVSYDKAGEIMPCFDENHRNTDDRVC
jgi:hypothetical protein